MNAADRHYDVVLRGGEVIAGDGSAPWRADLGVSGGRITAVGDLNGVTAATVIDATGHYLMPGFVDTHIHADAVLTDPEVQQAMLRQGITSAVLGQDGVSFAPGSAETVRYVGSYFSAINGAPHEAWVNGCSVADLLATYERATPINVAYLVPLGTVRYDLLGPVSRRADSDELARMVGTVIESLEQGAVGISTGLEYVPGVFADHDELSALCRPAARVGAPYVSHLRSYAGGDAPGMGELVQLSAETGVAGHVSHYRGRAEPLGEHLDRAHERGLDVTFDAYPHLKSNTILAMKALPPHIQDGGIDETLARLADETVRDDLCREWLPAVQPFVSGAVLSYVGSTKYAWSEGLSVAEASERAGLSFADFVCDVLLHAELAVGAVMPAVGIGDESDVRQLIRDGRHMGCSDGIYLGGHPHPRGWAAFACFLGRYTRELGDWTWGQAAQHLSGLPARRFGLADRGSLAVGKVADIAVVDPHQVSEQATYDEPRRLATGVNHVLVAGEMVLAEGTMTGARSGRALRRGEAGL